MNEEAVQRALRGLARARRFSERQKDDLAQEILRSRHTSSGSTRTRAARYPDVDARLAEVQKIERQTRAEADPVTAAEPSAFDQTFNQWAWPFR